MKQKNGHVPAETHRKLYGLDHLRALAISFVFLFHYNSLSDGKPGWLTGVGRFGWTGVDLFFVLSGFLISSQLFSQIRVGKKIRLKDFFLKRFFRILPAFWVVVAIYYSFPFFREREALPSIWTFLTFTQNFGLNLKNLGTFSHAWSLCVEEHFYLFLPLTLIALQITSLARKSYWLLGALFLFGFATRIYSFNHLYLTKINDDSAWMYWYRYIYYPTYNRLDSLLVGVSIAAIYQFLPNTWLKISKYGNHLMLLSLVVLTGAYFLCYDTQSYVASVFGFPVVAAGYGLLVVGAISPSGFLYKWNSRVTTFIATLSYAIYLTHKGIIHMTHEILLAHFTINDNLLLFICIITCVTGALALHFAVERPFMKLRNKIINI